MFLVYYYNSGGNQGAVNHRPYQMLNIGNCDKLSVSLQAQDIFHTMRFKETEDIHFQQIKGYCLWNYSIGIIYCLNKEKLNIMEIPL